MERSEHIDELATALSAFQGEVTDPKKGKTGQIGHRKYDYADLSSVLESARPLLAKHGLSLIQLPGYGHETVTLQTVLAHRSGQYIAETLQMGVERRQGESVAQAVGVVITYARRYAAAAVLGITQVDDDGAAGSGEPVQPAADQSPLTDKQRKELADLLSSTNSDNDKFFAHLGVESFAAMTQAHYNRALFLLAQKRKQQKLAYTDSEPQGEGK